MSSRRDNKRKRYHILFNRRTGRKRRTDIATSWWVKGHRVRRRAALPTGAELERHIISTKILQPGQAATKKERDRPEQRRLALKKRRSAEPPPKRGKKPAALQKLQTRIEGPKSILRTDVPSKRKSKGMIQTVRTPSGNWVKQRKSVSFSENPQYFPARGEEPSSESSIIYPRIVKKEVGRQPETYRLHEKFISGTY